MRLALDSDIPDGRVVVEGPEAGESREKLGGGGVKRGGEGCLSGETTTIVVAGLRQPLRLWWVGVCMAEQGGGW